MIHVTYYEGAAALPRPSGQAGGFENAEGSGEIRCFSLLDGVTAMLMRLEMESYTELRRQTGLLELNFCVNGRFETRFSLRNHVLLKPGDMAISCCDGLHGAQSESHFPWAITRASVWRWSRPPPPAGSGRMRRRFSWIFRPAAESSGE